MAQSPQEPQQAPAEQNVGLVDYSNLHIAADNHAVAGTGQSIFQSTSDFATKGVPLIGLSIYNSFVNTGVELGNWFGADWQKNEAEKQLQSRDDNLLSYYQEHEMGIETAGLIAGSFIPGSLAIKGLKLATAGKGMANFSAATGLLRPLRTSVLQDALDAIKNDPVSLYGMINNQKLKAIGLGFADQALQAGAWELATVATMKANPMLDSAGYKDIINDMTFGVLLGGGIGGVIEGIGTRRFINDALLTASKERMTRAYTERTGVGAYIAGDKMITLLNSMDKLPEGTTAAERGVKSQTMLNAELDATKILNEMAGGDNELGIATWNFIKDMREQGQTPEEIYDHLALASKLKRVDSGSQLLAADRVYVNEFTPEVVRAKGITFNDLMTNTPHENASISKSYVVKDKSLLKIARIGDPLEATSGPFAGRTLVANNAHEAFNDFGVDVFVGADLKIHVNPESKFIREAPRAGEGRVLTRNEEAIYRTSGRLPAGSQALTDAGRIVNLRTGEITDRVFPTVGDVSNFKNIQLSDKGLIYGMPDAMKTSVQYIENGFNYLAMNAIDANARYVWAKMRGLKNGDKINHDDLPLLEEVYRYLQKGGDPKSLREMNVQIRNPEGVLTPVPAAEDFSRFLNEKIDEVATKLLSKDKISMDEVAQRANVSRSYLENGMNARNLDEIIIDPLLHTKPEHVRFQYNISNMNAHEGFMARGMVDHQIRINYAKEQAQAAFAAFAGADWESMVVKGTAKDANILGSGPGAFTSSNAEYGTLAQETEHVGASSRDLLKKRQNEAADQLMGPDQTLRANVNASAEHAIYINARRATGQLYTFVPDEIAAKYLRRAGIKEGNSVVALRQSLVRDSKSGEIIDWNWDYVPPQSIEKGKPFTLPFDKEGKILDGKHTYFQLSPEVASYRKASISLNDERLVHENNRRAAIGDSKSFDLGNDYVHPIDTKKYNFVALVRQKEGLGNGSSSVAAITAQTQAALEAKVGFLGDQYEIYYKGVSKKYHEVLGDYDYNMNLVDNVVDTDLKRRGILSDVLPDARGETALNDAAMWHMNQETRLVRNYVELANAQLFAELRSLGEPFVQAATSKVGRLTESFGRSAYNPFDSYIKTALDISEKSEYRLWQDANEKVEALFSTAFRKAKELFGRANKGLVSYEEANSIVKSFGLGSPYADTWNGIAAYREASRLPLNPDLSRYVQKANSVLAATAIRLDMFQSLVNVISTPVMMLGEMASLEKKAALAAATSTELPGVAGAATGKMIPARSKLIFQAVNDFFSDNKETLMAYYKDTTKTIRGDIKEYYDLLDKTAVSGFENASKLQEVGKQIVDLGSKLALSNWSEDFVRFVASRVGHLSFEAMGYEGVELANNIRTFVNRVHGNHIASQRPIAFQGVLGQAIGLFQTYQFNMLQQVFKHVEAGDMKAVAMMTAMQSSLFGIQGLPGFQAINTHIIGNAANNPNHNDSYSVIPQLFDKKLGDYLLYGVASNWLGSGVYTRGDINPRQVTVLPVNPMDIPSVSAGIRFVSSLLDVGAKINDGGKWSESILNGLEHNGMSRPLAGLGQVVQGYSTTSKGSLIAAANDWYSISSASRILGARPLDEAVVMDAMFRKTAYDAKDSAHLEQLGEAVKTTLYANGTPSPDEIETFASRYAASGGRIENFNRYMVKLSKDANVSVANQMYQHLKSGTAVNVMKIMGGQQLPDFSNASTSSASTASAPAL